VDLAEAAAGPEPGSAHVRGAGRMVDGIDVSLPGTANRRSPR
jgi:hypothetical protein